MGRHLSRRRGTALQGRRADRWRLRAWRGQPAVVRTLAFAALAGWATTARSQEPPSDASLQRVEITGSRLKRVESESDAPVQVIRRDEIVRSGATSVRDLLDQLTITDRSALSDITGSGSFGSGGTAVDLRGLGKQGTLVLLNFRRVAPYALADFSELFTNLDALPVDAIDRIEVLKSGAAALYGSDAVAGVINLITRSDYEGLELRLGREQSITSGTFPTSTASLSGGIGQFERDGYNLLLNVELYRRRSVMWSEVLGYVNPALVRGADSNFGMGSTYSFPGNYPQPDGSLGPAANCPRALVQDGLCTYDRYARFQAVPASSRASGYGQGRLRLGGDLTAFAEANFAQGRTTYLLPYPTYGTALRPVLWGDPDTLQTRSFTYYGLPVAHPLNGSGVSGAEFRYRFTDAASQSVVTSDQYRLLGGLRGATAAWEWESATGVMGSRNRTRERGSFSDTGFRREIGDYTALGPDGQPSDADFFNHGYRLGGPNSAAVIDDLFPSYGYRARYDQVFADGKASRTLAAWPAGPLDLAVGAEWRHERYRLQLSDALLQGDIIGNGLSRADASRSFGALFAELRVPVLRTLELSPALRVDKYPKFPTHASPKLGLRWTPSPALLLRGTVETGFRAPNLTESAPATKFAYQPGVSDPARCPAAEALAEDLRAQADRLPDSDPRHRLLVARAEQVKANECSGDVANLVKHNPGLKPETSLSATLGLVFDTTHGVTGSIDWWRIRRRNEIGIPDIDQLLLDERNPPAGNTIARLPGNARDPTFTDRERARYDVTSTALERVTQQFSNRARTRTQGFDFGLQSESLRLPVGSLRLSGEATYVLEYRRWSETRGGYGDNLAGRYGHPRALAYVSGSWQTGPVETTLRVDYRSPQSLRGDFNDDDYSVAGCAAKGWSRRQCRVASDITWDAYWVYTGIPKLELVLGIRNLFNRLPPANLRALDEDGQGLQPQELGDAQGRMLRLGLRYEFL